jgi:hypothetical protein
MHPQCRVYPGNQKKLCTATLTNEGTGEYERDKFLRKSMPTIVLLVCEQGRIPCVVSHQKKRQHPLTI